MVNVVKDGLAQLQLTWGPHTPEDQKPPTVEETPWAAPKAKPTGKALPFLGAQLPSSPQGPLGATPSPFLTPIPPLPSLLDWLQPPKDLHQRLSLPGAASSPLHCKGGPPDAFKGKIGLEAKQWLTRMLAWVCLNQRQFPLDLEVLSFLLMNMEEAAGAWAHPHLDQLGSCPGHGHMTSTSGCMLAQAQIWGVAGVIMGCQQRNNRALWLSGQAGSILASSIFLCL
ncbi:hypothetical protein RHS01_09080 [Rhizoctonia solani]|uniref:Uncharacterized protein n=1 Tax=Rhizoctonia solani TaxID=456999 RepID=A0A8H7LY80_9AGAM|nr:hypothetical protein RHS01_09080 [Rhizoctonia solani]